MGDKAEKKDEEETRVNCCGIISEILGKYKTFSSGDNILAHILTSPQLLKVYDMLVKIKLYRIQSPSAIFCKRPSPKATSRFMTPTKMTKSIYSAYLLYIGRVC